MQESMEPVAKKYIHFRGIEHFGIKEQGEMSEVPFFLLKCIFHSKYLHNSKKSINFAVDFNLP